MRHRPPRVPDWVLRQPEPTRARHPDEEGYAERDGVRIFYEVYGSGSPTFVLFYPWAMIHSRAWKAQVPYLARHFRVIVIDPRGARRSDRPRGLDAYRLEQHAADVLAVMDATGTEQAVLVSISIGSRAILWLAAEHPERVAGGAMVGPFVPLTPWPVERARRRTFLEPSAVRRAAIVGAAVVRALPQVTRSASLRRVWRRIPLLEASRKIRPEYWRQDLAGFAEFFASRIAIPDRHSTRLIEEFVTWTQDTDAETVIESFTALDIDRGAVLMERDEILACIARVRCPMLVIQGSEDLISPPEWGAALAELTGGRLVRVEGCGHDVRGRKPVAFNLALRDFAESLATPADVSSARGRAPA